MSRIGNRVLALPVGVEVSVNNFDVTVKGPKGELKNTFSPLIEVSVSADGVKTVRKNENKHTKQLHGTTNSLLKNMIIGVSEGYNRELEINGVGYKAALAGDKINLSLGYSHPVEYVIPKGVTVEIPKPTIIKLSGIDKQLVGQAAAHIREYRRPEPYKGKGIKYKEERIIRKEGKKAGK